MASLYYKIRLIENKIKNFVCFVFLLNGFLLGSSFLSWGQDINFPNSGGGTYNSCGGIFRDPGGTGNYQNPPRGSDPWDQIIYICNPTPGQPISVYFNEFQLARNSCVIPTYDELWVGAWNGSYYAVMGYYSSHPDGGYNATGVSHSSDFYVSGSQCLAFRFIRDQINSSWLNPCGELKNAAGWKATLSTPPPNAGTIDGIQTLCSGATTNYVSNGQTGGTWSSANSTIASVSASGIVSANNAGTTTISYTVSDNCNRTNVANRTITVNGLVNAGSIDGVVTLCTNTTFPFTTNGNSGGTWTSSNPSLATVNPNTGLVTPNQNGQTGAIIISYQVNGSGDCPSSTATFPVSIIKPPDPGSINGTATFCLNDSTTLASTSTYSGVWSSDNTTIATVNNVGKVTPHSDGNATISYTITAVPGCASVSTDYPITVMPLPNAGTIDGDVVLCLNDNGTVYSDGLTGGSWSSNLSTTVEIESASGNVEALEAGTATVSYSVTDNNGCTNVSTKMIIVNALPNTTISGTPDVCVGGQTQLSAPNSGGTWISDNSAVVEVNQSGQVTGESAGTATVYYTVTDANNCSNTSEVLVSAWTTDPPEIIGADAVCLDGQETLSSELIGGTWTANSPSVLTIDPSSGTITNVATGTATVTYTVNQAGCIAVNSKEFTIHPLPDAGTIDGIDKLCLKSIGTLTASITGGVWSSQYESVAVVDEYGNVNGVVPGTTSIIYTVTDEHNCSNQVSRELLILALPNPGFLSGVDELCSGETTTFISTAPMLNIALEEWSSNQPNIAFVDGQGVIIGSSAGTATITHKLIDYNNCSNQTSKVLTVLSSNAGTISGVSSIVEGYSTQFISDSPGGTWATSNTLASAESQTGKVIGLSAGETVVYYILSNMCGTDTARANLIITTSFGNLQTPQILSPNGDGSNDKWIVDFLTDYPNNSVYIYNRWGTKVFEQKGYGPGKEFVGSSNIRSVTHALPNGTYFYIIDLQGDGKNMIKGYVELQR